MCLGAFSVYAFVIFIIGAEHTTTSVFLLCTAISIYLVCFNLLNYAAKAVYSEDGKILDSGTDLNMEGGIAEHVKDMIILTAITQLLSIISTYFWLLLFLAPFQAFFILWRNVLSPWFFQQDTKQTEADDKKQKRADKNRQ
ncbi:transmembrane protein 208 isoform X2 [Arctopsyche grandis]